MMACQLMTEQSPLTIGIVGAGAMGALFGVHLAEAGADPLLVDVDPAVVERLNTDGVTLQRPSDVRQVPVRATLDPAGEPPVDVLLLFVKCYATEAALALAAPLIGDHTLVLSLQNGWGNADRIVTTVPPERVFAGVTYHSATLVSPGVVAHTAVGRTYLGPIAGGAASDAERLRDVLAGAGLEAEVSAEITSIMWRKLTLNASANPVAALTGLSAGGLADVPEVFALIEAITREVAAVGTARGDAIDADDAVAYVRDSLVMAGPTTTSSMRQDVAAGRRTEYEVVTGAVLDVAEQTGVDVPYTRLVHALILGYEASRAQG